MTPTCPENYLKPISLRIPNLLHIHAKTIAAANGMDLSSFIRQGLIRNIQTYIAERK